MRTIAHIIGYLPVAIFATVAAYYVYGVVHLLTLENVPPKFSWRGRAFLACALIGFLWLLIELILFGILGNPAEGYIREGKYYASLGRGDYIETTRLWWWLGLVAIWTTRVLFGGSLIALLVTLWHSGWSSRAEKLS